MLKNNLYITIRQRPELLKMTNTWHASNYKAEKLHQLTNYTEVYCLLGFHLPLFLLLNSQLSACKVFILEQLSKAVY